MARRRAAGELKEELSMAGRKRRAGMKAQRASWATPGAMNGGDIEAIAFLVLMQAAKSAREDLKAVMDAVRELNRRKARRREARQAEKKACRRNRIDAAACDADGATRKALKLMRVLEDLSLDELRKDVDSMSEIGEMESLRLQMAMDRLSKMMSALSNLLKKTSDTADAIARNLK
jgi:hypothetical protein